LRRGKGHVGDYRCAHCGERFAAASAHAVRCCGKDCEAKLRQAEAAHREALAQAGFASHPSAPNAMVKDGYVVTLEETRRGLDKALERHAAWVSRQGAHGSR
jgi:hypothetical protein